MAKVAGTQGLEVLLEREVLRRLGGMTLDDATAEGAMVSVVTPSQRRGMAQQRLDELVQASGALAEAPDVEHLARRIVRAACRGSGAARALLLQPTDTSAPRESAPTILIRSCFFIAGFLSV